MSRSDPQFMVRLPKELLERVRAAADANNRPMVREVANRIEETFQPSMGKIPSALQRQIAMIAEYYKRDQEDVLIEVLKEGVAQMVSVIDKERVNQREARLAKMKLTEEQFAAVLEAAKKIKAGGKALRSK